MTIASESNKRFDARFDIAPPATALAEFAANIAALRARSRVSPRLRDRTFLIVTPLGASCRARLQARLLARAWTVSDRIIWPNWARTSSAIYVWQRSPARLLRGVAYQGVWERLFPNAPAEIWVLGSDVHHRELAAAKTELRRGLPHLYPRMILPELSVSAKLHPFHVPDRWELAIVAKVASSMSLSHLPPRFHVARNGMPWTDRPVLTSFSL